MRDAAQVALHQSEQARKTVVTIFRQAAQQARDLRDGGLIRSGFENERRHGSARFAPSIAQSRRTMS